MTTVLAVALTVFVIYGVVVTILFVVACGAYYEAESKRKVLEDMFRRPRTVQLSTVTGRLPDFETPPSASPVRGYHGPPG